jgi:hypothetical protein
MMMKSWEKLSTEEKFDLLRVQLTELNRKFGVAMGYAEEAHLKIRKLEEKINN